MLTRNVVVTTEKKRFSHCSIDRQMVVLNLVLVFGVWKWGSPFHVSIFHVDFHVPCHNKKKLCCYCCYLPILFSKGVWRLGVLLKRRSHVAYRPTSPTHPIRLHKHTHTHTRTNTHIQRSAKSTLQAEPRSVPPL